MYAVLIQKLTGGYDVTTYSGFRAVLSTPCSLTFSCHWWNLSNNLYGSLLLLRLFYDIIGLGTKCSHKYFIPCVLYTVYLKLNFATLYFQGPKTKTKIIHKCNKKMCYITLFILILSKL